MFAEKSFTQHFGDDENDQGTEKPAAAKQINQRVTGGRQQGMDDQAKHRFQKDDMNSCDDRRPLNPWHADIAAVIQNAERIQQPNDDADHDHDVENFFDLAVHRDVTVDQPEQHADDDESDDEGY